MKRQGFTLIELMGVIIIIALITVLATPNIIEQIRKLNNEVSKTQMAIFETAADNYLSMNTNQYKLTNGKVYCITLQEIANAGMLTTPIVDAQTNEEIDPQSVLKATVRNNSYTYELIKVGEGTCVAK